MNIVVEKQPKCVATLRVEIPAEKVQGQRDQIVRGYATKARVPGFRPGKAPKALVEKRLLPKSHLYFVMVPLPGDEPFLKSIGVY